MVHIFNLYTKEAEVDDLYEKTTQGILGQGGLYSKTLSERKEGMGGRRKGVKEGGRKVICMDGLVLLVHCLTAALLFEEAVVKYQSE